MLIGLAINIGYLMHNVWTNLQVINMGFMMYNDWTYMRVDGMYGSVFVTFVGYSIISNHPSNEKHQRQPGHRDCRGEKHPQ